MSKLKLFAALVLSLMTLRAVAQEPLWNANAARPCDRACLVGIMDGYMNAIFTHNTKAVPPVSIGNGWTPGAGR